jgi:hypothetical protein
MARRILIILGHSDARPERLGCAFAETGHHGIKSFERNVRSGAMHEMRSGIAESRGVAPRERWLAKLAGVGPRGH